MFYASVPPLDHGLLEFPTNAYGGFAYRANTLERPTTSGQQIPSNPAKRFITEHNLGLFWRRPGLCPRTLALPVPLLSTGDAYATGTRNRPPGMMRTDCAPIRYRQRNLLAGELVQSDNSIRLWTVNDSSDHKQLLHYTLRIATNAANVVHRRENLLLCLEDNDSAAAVCRPSVAGRIALANEVLQLKAFVVGGGDGQHRQAQRDTGKVFLRSKNALQLANTTENTVSTIFHSQTFAFTQIPHMDGELAVVDSRGMLFWGHIDEPGSFARFKSPTSYKDICPTDCPRILVSIGEREARLVDLRDANCAGQLLFTHSIGSQLLGADDDDDGVGGPFSGPFHAALVARDRLCHVHTVDIGLETVLLTSSRRHTLVDPRMPGLSLLAMAHGEIDGADYCIVTPPFLDPETDGRVFSLYSLTHTKKPALSHWSLMYHPNECLWSSIGSKHELDTPRAVVAQFAQLHTAKMAAPSLHPIDTALVPKYTRAIHYQPLDKNVPFASSRALLFRQMEGGEIWYENVFFEPSQKLRQDDGGPCNGATEEEDNDDDSMQQIDETKMKEQCLEQISKYQSERKSLDKAIGTHFFERVQDEVMEFKRSKQRQTKGIDLTALEIASEIACSEEPITTSASVVDDGYPFAAVHRVADECCSTMLDELHFDEQFEEQHEAKLFSMSVSRIWQKTLTRWQEAREERAQNELGLAEDGEVEQQQQHSAEDDDGEDENNGEEEEEEEQEDYAYLTP